MTKPLQLRDKVLVTFSDAQQVGPGYRSVPARIAGSGIQEYLAIELWPAFDDRDPMSVIRVWRSPEEVFSPASMATFDRLPITLDHPLDDVRPSNWKQHAVGNAEGAPVRDGEHLKSQLLICDAGAISDMEGGKKDISCGWKADLVLEPGTTPGGENYDASVRNIVGNHIAIVDRGRCETCAIEDRAKSPDIQIRLKDHCKRQAPHTPDKKPEPKPMTKTVIVNGVPVEVADSNVATVLETVVKDNQALAEKLAKAETDLGEAKAEITSKDAEIKALKDAQPSEEDLDKRAQARAKLLQDAAPFLAKNYDTTGKSDADIRRDAVTTKMGDAMKDASDDEVSGAFAFMLKDAASTTTPTSPAPRHQDPFVTVQQGSGQPVLSAQDKARQSKADAWKRGKNA